MFLKSLEMQGFKSFADKTKLNFTRGLTAVVGPNGSGKSNISDAIRWVLGEQSNKNLRGEKMEDVIFSGTQNKKSQGFAYVSLTFDNKDRVFPIESDDITIGRKYYRSSESEYKINNNDVRLRDIHELFMDTGIGRDGYSVIGQGKISEIVGAKSDQRRDMFEEACGITKFRYKKMEAEKKLIKSEENLIRLVDIMKELENRIEPLKNQSDKAKKYIDLATDKKSLEISIWVYKIAKYKNLLSERSDEISQISREHVKISKLLEDTEIDISSNYNKMEQNISNIDKLRMQKEEIEQEIYENKTLLSVVENDLLHNQENIERISTELLNCEKLKEEFNYALDFKKSELKILKDNFLEVESNLLGQKQKIEEISFKILNLESNFKNINEKFNKLILNRSEVEFFISNTQIVLKEGRINIESMEFERKRTQSAILEIEDQLKSLNSTLDKSECSNRKSVEELDKINLALSHVIEKEDKIVCQINNIDIEIQKMENKKNLLEDYEKNLEGFSYSVKSVIKSSKEGKFPGVIGTVSSLITVSDEYSISIETALGSALQNIVVEDEKDANDIVEYLKKEKKGRVTLLPLKNIKSNILNRSDYLKVDGFVDIACNLLDYDKRFCNIFESLLGRVLISDSLENGFKIARKFFYKFKIVTLDGQIINYGGSITGGSSKNNKSGLLGRKNDIINLYIEIKKLIDQKSENKIMLEEIEREKIENLKNKTLIQDRIYNFEKDILILNQEKIKLENRILNNSYILSEINSRIEVEGKACIERDESILSNKVILNQINQEIKENEKNTGNLYADNDDLKRCKLELERSLNEFNIKKVEYKKDIDVLESSIKEIYENISNNKISSTNLFNSKQTLNETNISSSKKLINIKDNVLNKSKLIEKIVEDMNLFSGDRANMEQNSYTLRAKEKELSREKEKLTLELIKLEEKRANFKKEYDYIINKLWDEYQITLTESRELSFDIIDISKEEKRLNLLKVELKNLGNINIDSIEEYKDVSERYEFFKSQIEDIERSKKELFKLIKSLTDDMKNIFSENFSKINIHFKEIFVKLFGGGDCNLDLVGDDILDCGIEIYVQPPGKIIKNLMSLSGGEQSMVAICLYFAILKVRPSPFCVLDEIDAALDDINVSRYASYLKSMSSNTQFIMITHRRGTMERCDVLHGVTMQQEGISRILELKNS